MKFRPYLSLYRTIFLTLLIALPTTSLATDEWGTDEWSYRLSPYLWASAMEGKVRTLPPAPEAEVDMSFSDIWDNLDMGIMGFAEARKGRLGLYADVVYMDLGAKAKTPGPLFGGADLDFALTKISLGGSYGLSKSSEHELDLMAGLNLYNLDNELKLKTGLLAARSISDDESWQDVILGLKGKMDINENWYVNGWGTAAIAGDSDKQWDVYGGLGYRYSDSISFVGGYRHMELDYHDDAFKFDAEFSGPLFGATFQFQ